MQWSNFMSLVWSILSNIIVTSLCLPIKSFYNFQYTQLLGLIYAITWCSYILMSYVTHVVVFVFMQADCLILGEKDKRLRVSSIITSIQLVRCGVRYLRVMLNCFRRMTYRRTICVLHMDTKNLQFQCFVLSWHCYVKRSTRGAQKGGKLVSIFTVLPKMKARTV